MLRTNAKNSRLQLWDSENKFSDVLVYFSESLMRIDNEEELLWNLAKNCISHLGFLDCVVYLLDKDRDIMVQKAAYGPKNPKDFEIYRPLERPLGSGIVGYVAKTGIAEIIDDTTIDDRYVVDDELRYSEICVPIIIDGNVIGIIDCEHPDKYFFTEHHLQILLTIASITALKIKGLRTYEKYIKEQKNNIKVQKQLLDLKLKALGTQLNPHFVFNAINAIQYFITSEDKKSALQYLSIFSKLIRFYLKHLEMDTVKLKEEIDVLNLYLTLQKLRYNNLFDYEISEDSKNSLKDAVIPSFVLQALFENIIEHGIYNQHNNQKLYITFEASNDEVIVEVTYLHDTLDNLSDYTPEYRKLLTKWQDQIRLLNKLRPYTIKKEVNFVKNNNCSGGNIVLKLPNLK